MKKTRYVIIGGSAAGMAAAGSIRETDPNGSIIVLSEEPDMPYFRPMIPFLISGKKSDSDMMLMGQGPYQATDVEVRLETRATGIDTKGRTVSTDGDDTVPYDKLLIATGSRPYIPPEIAGTEAEGVFALRTLSDARALVRWGQSAGETVVLGAGLLGLKAALALRERGLVVTIIEQEDEVLPRLMEPDAGAFISEALARAGIKVMTGSTVKEILSGTDGVYGVIRGDGRVLRSQTVCVCLGVLPNVELLEQSGIRRNQGVMTDEFTACNVPNIFAAGDVAETLNPIIGETLVAGTWTNAVEMGRCAGYNMAGHPKEYSGTFGILNATQVADEPFVSMGIVHTSGTDYETHISSGPNFYRKLVFSPDGSRLVGALFVGDISKAGLYRFLIRERIPTEKIRQRIIDHKLHYGCFLRA